MPLKVVHTCDLIMRVNRNYVVVQIKMNGNCALNVLIGHLGSRGGF